MKATIKLHTSVKTKKGHPIIIYLSDKYQDKRIRLGFHSDVKDWNTKLCEPKKSHSDYYELHRKVKEVKNKLSQINYECNSIDEALLVLKKKNGKETFFEICAKMGKYDTKYSALKSFDTYYPNIKPGEITSELVQEYINSELKKRKSGGVDSYLRSLKAVWNKNFTEPNPFRVSVKVEKTKKVVVQDHEIKLLQKVSLRGRANDYRNFFLLQLYLGGIDFEVLARLKKTDIINGRIEFNRNKGNSDTFCSNKVFKLAQDLFYEGDYLIPVQGYVYREFRSNYTRRIRELCQKLDITEIRSKTARYTFINRGKNLLIDQRIVGQIVGHKFSTTTGLYENDFPFDVQDEAHKRIIDV